MDAQRIPVFIGPQIACDSCGREITDARALDAWGRYCSARCYHARGLPLVFRRGA